MQKKISTDQLKIGMYIKIPRSWLWHSFFQNEFKIKSQTQLNKLLNSKIKEVIVDTERSDIPIDEAKKVQKEEPSDPDENLIIKSIPVEQDSGNNYRQKQKVIQDKIFIDSSKKDQESFLPPDFEEKIKDKNTEPQEKAQFIYESTQLIMQKVLEKPTHSSISNFKRSASPIVDSIVENQETSQYLLNITSHDVYTYNHSVNVGIYSLLLAKAVFDNSIDHDMHRLGAGFFLHDIGKVKIENSILNKEEELTSQEFNTIMKHPVDGYKILSETDHLNSEAKIIVLQHHERFDGSGYPRGLKGNQIHLYGRICSIADVFDALTSNRPYREKLPPYEALELMKNEMLNHFQEDLFDQFVLLFE
jgi:HD-GYP domain-containing protein (c-di-GMP phosphodiesterase class II)